MNEATQTAETPDIQALKAAYIEAKERHEQSDEAIRPLKDDLQHALNGVQAVWESQHAEKIAANLEAFNEYQTAEGELRKAIVAHYEATKEKTIDENLSARVTTKFEYEMPKAVEWAETNAPILIHRAVDAKAFEKNFAETCDFVTKIEKASAVIKGI